MSTAPILRAKDISPPAGEECFIPMIDEMRRLAEQDDCVVNRQAAALGVVRGLLVGAALWAAGILAVIALLKR